MRAVTEDDRRAHLSAMTKAELRGRRSWRVGFERVAKRWHVYRYGPQGTEYHVNQGGAVQMYAHELSAMKRCDKLNRD